MRIEREHNDRTRGPDGSSCGCDKRRVAPMDPVKVADRDRRPCGHEPRRYAQRSREPSRGLLQVNCSGEFASLPRRGISRACVPAMVVQQDAAGPLAACVS